VGLSENQIVKVAGGHVECVGVERHRCCTPETRRFNIGDVFVCGECGRRQKLHDAQGYQGGPYWGDP